MKYEFDAPDKVMVGVRGEVGNRLFLLQARQGRRLVILKCEKVQLAALAQWISQVIDDMGRPGHLPDDFTLEPEYEASRSTRRTSCSRSPSSRRARTTTWRPSP
ncbi:MAG: hypothetical protein B7W95_01305 [Acidimicrobiales bacterium 20-64-4]|nr:MAG: hypothetical protein B7W95_01305 [Acidimicrobiales bacterium 20-64-4]